MGRIIRVELWQTDLTPKARRIDPSRDLAARQAVMVRVVADDGANGTGYACTIGTDGSPVLALLRDRLAPRLIGRDETHIEAIWKDLFLHAHATSVGPITSLALAAVDTALWDLKCKRARLPLHLAAGGAQQRVPVYRAEGGWLRLEQDALVDQALEARTAGFRGARIEVGHPQAAEDIARLSAVRERLGPAFELMAGANQAFTLPEALRRARHYQALDLAWLEAPLPAEDIDGHVRLSQAATLPIAAGQSLHHPAHFREYLQRSACSVVQADVARVGGITPWLKIAHLAETFNVPVCPPASMELHVGLCAAVPNAAWLEHVLPLEEVTMTRIRIEGGYAYPSCKPGLGIDWNEGELSRRRLGSVVALR